MTIERLDSLFPYVCFAYGTVMTLVLGSSALARLADERLPADLLLNYRSHRGLAMVCLVVGGLWILQNLWLT